MPKKRQETQHAERLGQELRRGALVLAVLSRLRSPKYGYSLIEELGGRGLEVEQGTLYPLLRRLDEQGLLESSWNVEGARPRKYYELSDAGRSALESLTASWQGLVQVLEGLLEGGTDDPSEGDER